MGLPGQVPTPWTMRGNMSGSVSRSLHGGATDLGAIKKRGSLPRHYYLYRKRQVLTALRFDTFGGIPSPTVVSRILQRLRIVFKAQLQRPNPSDMGRSQDAPDGHLRCVPTDDEVEANFWHYPSLHMIIFPHY